MAQAGLMRGACRARCGPAEGGTSSRVPLGRGHNAGGTWVDYGVEPLSCVGRSVLVETLGIRLAGTELRQAPAHDVRGRNPRGVPPAIGRVEVCVADIHGDQDGHDGGYREHELRRLETRLAFRESSALSVAIGSSTRTSSSTRHICVQVRAIGRHDVVSFLLWGSYTGVPGLGAGKPKFVGATCHA